MNVFDQMIKVKKYAQCKTCTIKLVSIAYQRAPMFRLLREPLKFGMRFFAWVYRVDPAEYEVRTPACYNCIRFYKVALKEKSGLFCWLNDRVNPIFDVLLKRVVTSDELQSTQDYARRATQGTVNPEESREWMKGQKTGF
jgi:hypothetical protein